VPERTLSNRTLAYNAIDRIGAVAKPTAHFQIKKTALFTNVY